VIYLNIFVPYNKLGKKARRKIDLSKRRTWNGVDPVTKKTGDSKAYDRKKAQKGEIFPNGPFYLPSIKCEECLRALSAGSRVRHRTPIYPYILMTSMISASELFSTNRITSSYSASADRCEEAARANPITIV
jgi:hypothetical protein